MNDPMTSLDEACAGLHEMYRSLTAKGRFTKVEACIIIGTMLAQQGQSGGHTDDA